MIYSSPPSRESGSISARLCIYAFLYTNEVSSARGGCSMSACLLASVWAHISLLVVGELRYLSSAWPQRWSNPVKLESTEKLPSRGWTQTHSASLLPLSLLSHKGTRRHFGSSSRLSIRSYFCTQRYTLIGTLNYNNYNNYNETIQIKYKDKSTFTIIEVAQANGWYSGFVLLDAYFLFAWI